MMVKRIVLSALFVASSPVYASDWYFAQRCGGFIGGCQQFECENNLSPASEYEALKTKGYSTIHDNGDGTVQVSLMAGDRFATSPGPSELWLFFRDVEKCRAFVLAKNQRDKESEEQSQKIKEQWQRWQQKQEEVIREKEQEELKKYR